MCVGARKRWFAWTRPTASSVACSTAPAPAWSTPSAERTLIGACVARTRRRMDKVCAACMQFILRRTMSSFMHTEHAYCHTWQHSSIYHVRRSHKHVCLFPGSYFAVQASYSDRYTDGGMATGTSTLRRKCAAQQSVTCKVTATGLQRIMDCVHLIIVYAHCAWSIIIIVAPCYT